MIDKVITSLQDADNMQEINLIRGNNPLYCIFACVLNPKTCKKCI